MTINPKFKSLITTLGTIPEKLVNGFIVFMDGVIKQFSTLKGACLALLGLAIVADLLTQGHLQIITFMVTTGKDVIVTVLEAIKGKWLELVMIAILIVVAKK